MIVSFGACANEARQWPEADADGMLAKASSARVLAAVDLRAKHHRQLVAEQRAATYFIAPAMPAGATMHVEQHRVLLMSRRDTEWPAVSLLTLRTGDRERPILKRFGHSPNLRKKNQKIRTVSNNWKRPGKFGRAFPHNRETRAA
jgi:hypothetical protein